MHFLYEQCKRAAKYFLADFNQSSPHFAVGGPRLLNTWPIDGGGAGRGGGGGNAKLQLIFFKLTICLFIIFCFEFNQHTNFPIPNSNIFIIINYVFVGMLHQKQPQQKIVCYVTPPPTHGIDTPPRGVHCGIGSIHDLGPRAVWGGGV